MVDEDHAVTAALHKANDLIDSADSVGVGPGEGLVEQKHQRVLSDGPAHLRKPLLTEGQVPGQALNPVQPDLCGDAIDNLAVGSRSSAEGAAERAEDHPGHRTVTGCGQSHEHVLADREVERQLRVLESPGQTQGRPAERWTTKMRAPQGQRSAVCGLRPRDQVDEGRLAGSVGTNQAQDLTCGEVEVDVGESDYASVVLPQAPTLEQPFASDGPCSDRTRP